MRVPADRSRRLNLYFPGIIAAILLPGFACGQLVTNGDFENVTIGAPYISSNPAAVPGWTRSGSPGDGLLARVGFSDPDGSITTAGHGNQFVILGGGQNGAASASWSTVVTGLIPNTTYSLSFLIANEGESSSQNITVSFPSGSSTAPQTFSTTSGAGQAYWKSWESKSMSFAPNATSTTIQFSANQRYDIGLDYVQVTAVSSGVSVVEGPVLTKSVSDPNSGCPVTAPVGVASFLVSDPIVTVWFKLGGLAAQSSVSAHFSQNGVAQPSLDSNFQPLPSSGTYVFCPSFLPQGSAGAAGQWTLSVTVNNQPVVTFPPFSVLNPGGGGFIGIWISPTLGTVTIIPGSGSTVNGSFTGSASSPSGSFTGTITGTQCGGTYVNSNGGTGVIIIVIITGGVGFTGTMTPVGGSPIPVSGTSPSIGGRPSGGFIGTWTSPNLGTVVMGLGGSTVTGSFTGGSSFPNGGTFTCTVIGNQCGGPYAANGLGSGTIVIIIFLNAGASSLAGTCSPTGGSSPIPVAGTLTSTGGGTGSSGNCGMQVTSDTSTATVNLTTEGTADWVTIGLDPSPLLADNCPAGPGKPTCLPKVRKAGVTPLIGPLQVIGGADTYVSYYGNDKRRLSWTGSDSTVPTVTGNGGGVYVEYGGFSITAPADTTARTFILHVSMTLESGPSTLTAHLSDGSAPDQVAHVTTDPTNGSDYNFKIVYQASKANQILTVSFQQDDLKHVGLLTFSGAALSIGGSITGTCAGGGGSTGGTPKIAVSSTTLDFGNVAVGQTPPAELPLVVTSTGTAPLMLSSLTIQNSAFTLVSPPQMPYTIGDAALQLRVRFTPTAAGTQSGSLRIASNDPDPSRSVLTISLSGSVGAGGQPGCSYDVRPTSLNDATGGGLSGVLLISTAPTCTWTTTVPDLAKPWVTLSPSSGTGPGGVGYTVAANTGAARNTTLTVATVPIIVQQAGASSCAYSLDATSKQVSGIQNGFGVTVTVTGAACAPWTVSIPSSAGWVHPGSASSFPGTNTATFIVDANPGPGSRSATVTINTPAGTKTVTIAQDAPPCSYTLSPLSSPTITASGTGSAGVNTHITVTGAVCAWSVSAPADSNSQWVHVTSAYSATGTGDINYTVDPNNTTSPRSVSLTITGQNPFTSLSYTISQAAGTQNTGPVPVISPGGVVNAASFIPANLPGGAIAQGSFFSIFGNGLGPTPSVQANQYPLNAALGNVSVKVTQGSISVNALPVFAAPFQVNAVMPSNTPIGDVQVTITYNGATSAPAAAKVVVSNFGAFAVSGGRGPGIVQNVVSQALRPLNAANGPATPGQYVTLWGTGLGPLPNSASDSQPPAAGTLPIPVKVFVGGKLADNNAEFFYSGRGPGLAGIDQFNFKVPLDAPFGCYVPVQVLVGDTFYSNTVSMAISRDGTACNDSNPLSDRPRTGGKNGSVTLIRLNITDTNNPLFNGSIDLGMAGFSQKPAGGDLAFDLYSSLPPVNSCTYYNNLEALNGVLGLQLPSQGSPDSIDAGSAISVKGAKGTEALPYSDANSAKSPYLGLFGGTGPIAMVAPGQLFLDPGSYTISGPGGKDVGPFSFIMNIPTGATWTNRDQISMIDRSQGLAINWSGGNPVTQVGLILGFSTNPNTKVSGGFACLTSLDTGTFTVQPGNMANLPGGAGATNVQSKLLFITVPRAAQTVKFTTSAAPNLDNGFGLYAIGDMRTVMFK